MKRRLQAPAALVAALALSGCAAGAIPGGIGALAGAPTSKSGNTFAGGDMQAVAGTPTASTSAPKTNASTVPTSNGKPGSATSGIGLGTFFDSYNFDFPVPAGQALGTVANLSQAAIAPTGGKVYLQVGLQTTDQLPKARKPLNVSFVFDKSGSMAGEKIQYSRLAAQSMVDTLGEQDLFSLVTFDTNVSTLIAPAFAVDREAMKLRIGGIEEGSSTNIDGGLEEGYDHVQKNYDQGKINRVILMSDGEANVGLTDKESLGARAKGFADRDMSLTTIGVGTGFAEDFMTHLATEGRGTFYFVNSASDAQAAFAGEIKTLQRIVASDVKLNIQLAEGVKLTKVYGHTPKTAGQSLNVDSNDLIAQQSKVLLLELEVPAGEEGQEASVASVSVDFEDVAFGGGQKNAKAEAKVRYAADAKAQADSRDSKVASSVINLQAAAAMLSAASYLDGGDEDSARTALNDQHKLVLAKAEELGDQDLRDLAASLKRYLDRLGSDDREVLKKELQFEAFQMQQGKKKTTGTPAPVAAATPTPAPTATPTPAPEATATPTPAPEAG